MDRSNLQKKKSESEPSAHHAVRSGSVADGRDNLIQKKLEGDSSSQAQAGKINSSSPVNRQAKQLAEMDQGNLATGQYGNKSSRLLDGANTASKGSVEAMRRSTQLKQTNGFSVLQRAGEEEASEAAAAEESKSIKSFGDEKTGDLTKPEPSFDKFELAMTATGAVSTVTNLINMAATGGREEGDKSADTDSVSAIVAGMIGAVQTAYREARKVYSVFEDAKRLEAAGKDSGKAQKKQVTVLAMAKTAKATLSVVASWQKKLDGLKESTVMTALPIVSMVLNIVGMIQRRVADMERGNLDLAKTEDEERKSLILKNVTDEKNREAIQGLIAQEDFKDAVIAAANFRQIKRDNQDLFDKYDEAQKPKQEELRARLESRYPSNYARMKKIKEATGYGPEGSAGRLQALEKLGIPKEVIDKLIDNRTLIAQLAEIKGKRDKNSKIAWATDFLNLAGDIATLSGAAPVGAAAKGLTAAFGAGRAAGNAIKTGARDMGADEFKGGAKGGFFSGAAWADKTDILRGSAAKHERTFQSASIVFNHIVEHDKAASAYNERKNLAAADYDANNGSYEIVKTEIAATGASLAMTEAYLHTAKSGNEVVKYFMDKLKER
ncbi:MAG: hypothetical protein P8N40_02155 [Gammaproteobacteria bacterium]|nr:hypothetical protein [Gammaproteobacteria bacterium]